MAKSMSKSSKNKESTLTEISHTDLSMNISRKILKVKAFTPICKPLNGSLPSSKVSHMLKLSSFGYKYGKGNETKTSSATAYMIKGIRGALRHQVMANCKERGLEVCHTSDKKMDKKGNSLLLEGFHLLGSCLEEKECMVHSVFGSKGHRGKIRISVLPIANITHKTYQTHFKFQNVHIATENRVAMTFDGQSIQDFGERYFSGEFEFEIDVSKCTAEETGMIIEAAMYMQKLGRGYNTGYGELKIISLNLVKSMSCREPKITEKNNFSIKEHLTEETIPGEFTDALAAWKSYLKNSRT
jgi:hypothetical protein